MKTVVIYTDGACKGNPGPGGWGALLRAGEHRKELFGGEPHTTNNRMELRGVIEGLKALKRPSRVRIQCDSAYVVNAHLKGWIERWQQNGWKTSDRKAVKNADLWRELEALADRHTIRWHWVRGHADDPGNLQADALANRGVEVSSLAIKGP